MRTIERIHTTMYIPWLGPAIATISVGIFASLIARVKRYKKPEIVINWAILIILIIWISFVIVALDKGSFQ